MKSWLFRIFQKASPSQGIRSAYTIRPQVELLEDRLVPALINHGGPVLSTVQVQALYLGSAWSGSLISSSAFDGFLNTTVNTAKNPTPYLAMLKTAGFTGVTGVGGVAPSVQDPISVPADLTDAQIQVDLQAAIKGGGAVQAPTANTLYFVFVQPGTVVDFGNGETSVNAFLAYHSWINGTSIRYAVVPYHGSAGNAQDPWLTSAFDSMTVAASHELAESITDPTGTTWYDRSGNEIGDIVNGATVDLNGYAVQREAAIPGSQSNFLAMTPAGAAAGHSTTFAIVGGALQVSEAGLAPFIAANPTAATGHAETGSVASISTQGVDDFGQPMVDVRFSDGYAYEYHDFLNPQQNQTASGNPGFFPWTELGANVKQAVAGQGVSYVLFTNGNLEEYVDPNYNTFYYGYGVNPASRSGVIAGNVTSINAVGVDQLGVNAVEYTSRGATLEWRDVTATAAAPTSTTFKAHPSEIPATFGIPLENSGALLLQLQSTPAATPYNSAAPSFSTPPVQAPSLVSLLPSAPQSVHIGFPDGGGGGASSDASTAAAPTSSDASAPSLASPADVPVLGVVFTEAVRKLKAAPFVLPAGVWPAAPIRATPPAPQQVAPPSSESRETEGGSWKHYALYGLPALVGLTAAGLEREERRRRKPTL